MSSSRFPVAAAAGAAAAATGALAWGAGVEVRSYRLRRVEVPVLRAGQRPFTILHISDLHLTRNQHRKADWVRALDATEPDLVVNTGDNLADVGAVPITRYALEPLLRRPGAFVLGSNDYFGPRPKNPATYLLHPSRAHVAPTLLPTGDLTGALVAAGWADLTNARARLDVGGRRIDLVGVDDPHLERDRYLDLTAPADPDADLSLGLAHAPYRRVLDAMTTDGLDLLLAGHTHGGQLCVPFYGALVTNCDVPRRFAKGLHSWHHGRATSWVHVSAGLGTSPYAPVRFACAPEATLLTLVAAPASSAAAALS